MKTTREHAAELIMEICKKVKGIGPSKGRALAEYLDGDWGAFRQAQVDEILHCKTAKDKSVFTREQAQELTGLQREFANLADVRSAWIYLIGKNFLVSQIRTLQSTTLSNMDINPFLMNVLNLKTVKEILEFNLYQTVTRSIVTSWGTAVEQLLCRCGAEKHMGKATGRAGRRPDIEKIVNDKKFYIQVKSGPNTMNIDMVHSLNESRQEYKQREPDASFVLGMTYGTRNRISPQIRNHLQDFAESAFIGRELWDLVSEEKDFHGRVFKILDQSSCNITAKTFGEHVQDRLLVLLDEWKQKFGTKSIDQAYEDYM